MTSQLSTDVFTSEWSADGAVVVCIDGSPLRTDVITWAAEFAHRHSLWMRIVFVAPNTADPNTGDPNTSASPTGLFMEAIQIAESVSPDLRIRTDLISGENTAILTALTSEAALIVNPLIVTPQDDLTAPAPACSFATVGTSCESQATADLPVVVGLDGSAYSESALAIAFKEAEAASTELVVVHAAPPEAELSRNFAAGHAPQHSTPLTWQLSGWATLYPGVTIRQIEFDGPSVAILEQLSTEARLLVVGRRGRGSFDDTALGTTSSAMIRKAHCPVIVASEA
ncbi:universal stress protein [Rhodococcus erythropolis]|uniref:Universal stress protein n=1 Tax=Rhodococcus erythropolis TaxID=1833 RepID=A0AAX3V812_RHOER|nr:universal stress protein [Rhodococcus erythropolis]WGV50791.2 universal stress protein [Rhodococcus erythropolis]